MKNITLTLAVVFFAIGIPFFVHHIAHAQPTVEADHIEHSGCLEYTISWMRDSITPLCEPLCATDADCQPADGRCRILNVADMSKAPPMLLVDDMSQEAIDAVMGDSTLVPPPVMVCDPFWDVAGATDAAVSADAVPL